MSVIEMLHSLIFSYGLVGLFFGSLLANASLFLLIPIDLVIIYIGSLNLFHPVLVGLVAGAGAAIGESVGYAVGFGGRHAIEKKFSKDLRRIDEIKMKFHNWGILVIFFGSIIPFAFDFIAIVAGIIEYNFKKFLLAVFAGRFLRYSILAFAASIGAKYIYGLFLA